MKPEPKKWLCGHKRSRFVPPTEAEIESLKTLTGKTSATHDQVKALRQLGADIPAAIVAGKVEIDV